MVEIDESVLVRRKYNKGRRLATEKRHIWIVGGIERSEKASGKDTDENHDKKIQPVKAFMVRVANRRKETIDHIVRKFIAPGTTLMTDGAAVYINIADRLPELNLSHKSVNHKKGEFVGFTDKTAYTNTIENTWRHLKWKITSYRHNGALDLNIADYLYRRTILKKNPIDDGPNLLTFLKHIALVYPGMGKEPLQLLEVIPEDMQNPGTAAVSDSDDDNDDNNNDTTIADINDRLRPTMAKKRMSKCRYFQPTQTH